LNMMKANRPVDGRDEQYGVGHGDVIGVQANAPPRAGSILRPSTSRRYSVCVAIQQHQPQQRVRAAATQCRSWLRSDIAAVQNEKTPAPCADSESRRSRSPTR